MTTARQLLFEHFVEWQKSQGNIKTLKDFAAFVGVDYKVLDHIFNGRRGLSEAVADRLAKALNNLEFYDLAEMARPDPLTFYIQRNIGNISSRGRREMAEVIAKYIEEKPPYE